MLPLSTKVLMAISVLPEGPPRVGTDRDRMGAIEQAESCAGRYVLASDDGRMVTYDTRTGPGLTASQALCYIWTTPSEAEKQRRAYQAALGVALTVRPQWVAA